MSAESTSKRNKGQFEKGNPGGPGNPHARQVARIRATLLAAMEPATLYEIVCRLIERAVNGNLEAIKILLAYTVGRPGKSNDLIELLSEHYPPPGQESGDRDQEGQESENHRQKTVETDAPPVGQVADLPKAPEESIPRTSATCPTEPNRHQTAQTAAPPVGQVADLPKAPEDMDSRTSGRLATCPTEPNRQQTAQTAAARAARRQQTAQSARILTAGLGRGRQQTGVTDDEPDALLSLMGKVLEQAARLPNDGSAHEISLVK